MFWVQIVPSAKQNPGLNSSQIELLAMFCQEEYRLKSVIKSDEKDTVFKTGKWKAPILLLRDQRETIRFKIEAIGNLVIFKIVAQKGCFSMEPLDAGLFYPCSYNKP